MKKRILSILMSLAMVLSIAPVGAFNLTASAATTADGLVYEISGAEVTITDYTGSAADVIIPAEIEGYPVTSIGDNAFRSCSSLTSITIPNSVTSIGDYAFYDCALQSVTIGNSVTSIGDYAFRYCDSLKDVYITDLAAWCNIYFMGSSSNPLYYADNLYINGVLVTDVVIPQGVTTISPYLLSCSSLTSVTVPDSVTSIGSSAFSGCSGLTSVTVPDSVTSIGDHAFSGCSSLTSITIPNSVTSIGDYAFYDCTSLQSVTIGSGVTSIGGGAFYDCDSLKSATIGNSVTSIGNGAFYNCSSLKAVYITDLAAWCNINFASWDSNPLCYADNLYINGSLATDIVIPSGVTSIGDHAFSGCSSLTSVTIGNSVTSIGDWAFSGCFSLTSVTIPNSVTSIGGYAFEYCSSLTSVTIGNSVTSIGRGAFINCDRLTSVTIPNSVTSIGGGAFNDCNRLKEFIIFSKSCSFNGNCGLNYTHTIYGFKGSTAEAFAEEIGAEFIDVMTIHTHTETTIKGRAPTYTTTGLTAGKKCSVCGTITLAQKVVPALARTSIKKAKVTVKDQTYNGKTKKPSVTVKLGGKTLKIGVHYTVTYKNNKNIGKATLTITGIGAYKDSVVKTFKINPKSTKISKVTAGKKSLKVTVGKQTKEVTGYEIQYSTSKKFKSAKKVTIKKAKTTSATIKKLKAKKTYYVRVRTYKTVNGKKYYSTWSTYKSKKTK